MNEAPLRAILGELGIQILHIGSSGWATCRCPFAELGFHERSIDNTPSFFVKVDPRGVSGFHCLACKEHGRVSTLARKLGYFREEDYGALVIRADMEEVPSDFGQFEERDFVDTPKLDPLNKAVYANMYPMAWEEPSSRTYLQARGIGQETAEIIGLQFDPDEQRVIFPVHDRLGQLFGFSGRTILDKADYPYRPAHVAPYPKVRDYNFRKELFLLGEKFVDTALPAVLVEGLFAFAHLVEIGALPHFNVLASFGSNLTDYQADKLAEWGLSTYLLYDDDLAGDTGLFGPLRDGQHQGGGAIDKLHHHVPTMLALYPEGLGDPDHITLEQLLHIRDKDYRIC